MIHFILANRAISPRRRRTRRLPRFAEASILTSFAKRAVFLVSLKRPFYVVRQTRRLPRFAEAPILRRSPNAPSSSFRQSAHFNVVRRTRRLPRFAEAPILTSFVERAVVFSSPRFRSGSSVNASTRRGSSSTNRGTSRAISELRGLASNAREAKVEPAGTASVARRNESKTSSSYIGPATA